MAKLGLLVALVAAVQAASNAAVYASSNSTSRKLLTLAAPCPVGATCVSNYAGTTFTSGKYYLSQVPISGGPYSGKYNWNTPSWYAYGKKGAAICGMACSSVVNCKGIGGNCATIASTGTTSTVDCENELFGTNYCDAPYGSYNFWSSAYCTSGGAGTAMSVLCQCPAPTASQYTVTPCGGCSGGYCSTGNTNQQCTATCPAGSYTSDTCGMGTVLYQPADRNNNNNNNQNFWNNPNNNNNNNCACASRQPVNIKSCPCAVASPPPPPSPSPPPPPSPAYLKNLGNGNGNQVGQDTQCTACSTCDKGYTVSVPCVAGTMSSLGQDTQCSQCAAVPANSKYVAAGSCDWKCADGFMPSGNACVKSPVASPPMAPTVYSSSHVLTNTNAFANKVTGGPTQHVLNSGATTSSTETTADGKVQQYVTTTTTDATQQGTGNGHATGQSTSTTTSDVGHPQTFVKYNSPPPVVYTSAHVLTQTTGFGPKVIGGPNQHVLNNGATTTSTETTALGKVNTWESTTTTDATQQGTGNGHTTSQSVTTSTTSTDHQQVFQKHNTHTTTTDLAAPPADSVPAAAAVCGGKSFAVQSVSKTALCMHVKGATGPDGFVISTTVKRPIITMPCVAGSPNQQFSWMPSAHGGTLQHNPTKLALSLASATVSDGTGVSLAAETGEPQQEWMWPDAAHGGTIASVANENFMITDSRVNADVSVGLPVHMWRLAASLPSGAPNAAWYANCNTN